MDPWQVELYEDVKQIMYTTIVDWGAVINKLGMSKKDRSEWTNIFKNECNTLVQEIAEEIKSREMNLLCKIESLKQHSENLYKQLNVKMPIHVTSSLGLYHEERRLIKSIKKLQEHINVKVNEINKLQEKQSKLCKCLGRTPINLPQNPLPSQKEIDEFSKHIEDLENEKFAHDEKLVALKCDIRVFAKRLNWKPSSEFEEIVLCENDNLFIVSDANMQLLEELHDSLERKLQLIEEEICKLREKVTTSWEILAEDAKHCDYFLQKYKENSLDTLTALEVELERCDKLKIHKIVDSVKNLRQKILILWNKCGYTEHQRNVFEFFHEDFYSEELLTLHELELEKLTEKYNENRQIYDSIEEREDLLSRLLKLEEKANGPDRYKNRGGQLLKEAKERTVLDKKIRKLENKALHLTRAYEEETGQTFLNFGETIDTLFQKSRMIVEEKKKLKLSAHKQKCELTPGTSYLSIIPGTSTSSSTKSSSTKSRITPLKSINTTTSRRNITPLFKSQPCKNLDASHKIEKKENRRRSRLHPPIIKLNNRTICKPRYSIMKKKRMEKLKRISKFLQQRNRERSNDSDSDYDFFEGIVPIAETSIVDLVS